MSAPIINIKSNRNMVRSYFGLIVLICTLATSTIFALGFRNVEKSNLPPMKMKVELEGKSWVFGDRWIGIAKTVLSKSDVPAKDVTMILDSLNSFQQELYRQLNPQFKAEDSLSKIKK